MKDGRIIALNHVGLSVADLDRARRFWIEGLGALDHGGWSWPVGTAPADESLATQGTAAEVMLLRTETAFLEVFAFTAPTPARRSPGVPGVAALTWAVDDVESATARALAAGGTGSAAELHCPDGTPIRLIPAARTAAGLTGLVGVTVRVAEPAAHPLAGIPGPVEVEVVGGAVEPAARPIDLGANHVCLDVDGIAGVRRDLAGTRWHHDVTESSGGIAAVCYGTTADGVLVELLESRSPEAFLARCRLAVGAE